jgi:hypothetical protein
VQAGDEVLSRSFQKSVYYVLYQLALIPDDMLNHSQLECILCINLHVINHQESWIFIHDIHVDGSASMLEIHDLCNLPHEWNILFNANKIPKSKIISCHLVQLVTSSKHKC